MVTVALDTGGADAAGPWIDRAKPTHPSLIDAAHVLDELLGIVNVPSGVWIDERGTIVRPPEPAFPWRPRQPTEELLAQLPPLAAEQLREAQKIRIEPEHYLEALRDWVANGERSRYALDPRRGAGAVGRSQHRPLSRGGVVRAGPAPPAFGPPDEAVRWFREAHRLQPENWTYKRQAWSLADPLQGPSDSYESDWLTEVRELGPENYYPPVRL